MWWSKLKSLFGFATHSMQDIEDAASIHKLVNYNALNKRKNVRILYPHVGGFGPYPGVKLAETELAVANVSVGGLLIIDDTDILGSEMGTVVVIEINWPDFSTKMRVKIVGAQLQRRHLQFVDFNAQVFLRISRLVKPGFLGSRFHRVKDDMGNLDATELWVGPTGESLCFTTHHEFAKLSVNGQILSFHNDSGSIRLNQKDVAAKNYVDDAIVLLANLPEPSHKVKNLIEFIERSVRNSKIKPTGTHG